MGSAKVLRGGAGIEDIGDIVIVIMGFVVFIGLGSLIIYIIYLLIKSVMTFNKPIAQYKKVLTVKKKSVKTEVNKYNEYKRIGDMTYVYPKSYNTYKYYIDGVDRNIYSISEFNYNRVEENDTIEVDIDEYAGDPVLYIRKIINFEKPTKVLGLF